MRFGGVDPSILRELSGVYKPFVKAFKELVSNAFDADAESVSIRFSDDFSTAVILDDGNGMTPFDFRNDFTRIGGGSRRWTGDRTRAGRLRIGSKGIGFLALARYCGSMRIRSTARRTFKKTIVISEKTRSISLSAILGLVFSQTILENRLSLKIRKPGKRGALIEGEDFNLDFGRSALILKEKHEVLEIDIAFDCHGLGFDACLDFDRLLSLADSADLETIEDFATIEMVEQKISPGTEIAVERIKPFVVRDLRTSRKRGFIRNISSFGGLERFIWQMSRCTAIPYQVPQGETRLEDFLHASKISTLSRVAIEHAGKVQELARPVYPYQPQCQTLHDDLLIDASLDEGGVKVRGFVAGYTGVIFPAEYRGLSIRVRGIAIGDPGFLHADHLLTGANKAALSQITGEIVVDTGLDAADTLNPGRESFYEESEHFKTLRRHLVGEGEHVGGILGKIISAILKRGQVQSALVDTVGRATVRRRAMDDVSSAVTHLISRNGVEAAAIRKMLHSKSRHVNGLVEAPEWDVSLPPRIGGLNVVSGKRCENGASRDHSAGVVYVDTHRPEWSWKIQLHDRSFDVLHRKGLASHPLAEIDLKEGRVYVNWGHSIRQQFEESAFLRFALAWVLAKETAARNGSQLMDLALEILSFATEKHG